ncbi:MAG TPA: beta-ketoacyl synthase N-terminal-like domain-containing protein, partial [Gemmatimonadota bacterium]|nr:beta-ketoacyl synthase N-terminal-like domain-containing protein [Gemmatimonadota bacterium]
MKENGKHRTAVIASACRTPIGKFLGALAPKTAPELGAIVVREAVARAGIDPETIDEVVMGQVVQAGSGQAPARQAAHYGGVPDTVPAMTINKVCGSGLKAVMLAAQSIRAGDQACIVAGGQESMSNAPFLVEGAREGIKFGDQKLVDAMIRDGLWCAFEGVHMGKHAELTAEKS